MQAIGVGGIGNHNLPFRIMSRGGSWSHQNPYCCYNCSKPEPPVPELQRVIHTPDQKGYWKRGTPPSRLQSQFPRPFASQTCPVVYSPVADDDSPRALAGCRFKCCKEIIKVEEPSAKNRHSSICLPHRPKQKKNMMPVGKK